MRRTFVLSIALSAAALLVTADTAQAQRWGVGIGRGGIGFGYGYGNYGYPGGYWGNHYGYGYPGYWGGNYNYGRGYGWRGYSNFGYVPNYVYSYPSYRYGYSGYAIPAYSSSAYRSDMQGYQSMYGAESTDTVRLRILVPEPDTRVWIDNNQTQQQGYDRIFESPHLAPGHQYKYHVKATWMENGKEVTKVKDVDVTAGQMTTVRFGDDNHDKDREPHPPVTPSANPPATKPPQ